MEFVEIPSFWCPHIDRAACTNFSLRTVELRPSESRKILNFSFLLSPFLSHELFLFVPPSFPFSLLLFFSPLLGFALTELVKGGNFLPLSSCHLCGPCFSSLFPYFFISFIASSFMWLIVSHTFKCTTWILPCVTLLGCHVASPKPCHVSSDTLRLEKREIPTVSESNEIRRGS